MRFRLSLCCAALLCVSSAAAQELPHGQVTEKVVCRADAPQSYPLFAKNYLQAVLLLGVAPKSRPENTRLPIQSAKAYALPGEKR